MIIRRNSTTFQFHLQLVIPRHWSTRFSPVITVTTEEIDASHDASSCDSSIHFKPKTTSETKVRKMLPTGPLDNSAVSYAKAFKATVTPKKKKISEDTSDSFEIYEINGSPSASDAGQETEASDESLNGSEDISGLSSTEDSGNDLSSSSPICPKISKQMRKMHPTSQESQRRSQK